MSARLSPWLVAAFGNPMAGDDAFGQLVAGRVQAMKLPDVEVANVGMQPYGLVHRLDEGHRGLVIVDAARATAVIPAGKLMDIDFFGHGELQLVHDMVLSTHGLAIENELELARRLDLLPPSVRLVTATAASFDIGSRPTFAMRRLVQPAARCVARIVQQWISENRRCSRA